LGHELIVRFFANLRRNCRSDKTMTGYRTTLFGFMAFLKSNGKPHIETVTREDISAYVEHEKDRGMSPCTVNTVSFRQPCIGCRKDTVVRQSGH